MNPIKIFTDCPDKFQPDQVVTSPEMADAVVLFSTQAAQDYASCGKQIYLVARRAPISLANQNIKVQVIRPENLDQLFNAADGAKQTSFVAVPVREPEPEPETVKNVIVVYSPGTNVGKSFVSSNAAAYLASQGYKTVLCDLDMGESGTWEMLNMREYVGEAERTISEWDGTPENIRQIVDAYEHHKVRNLYVLKRGKTANAAEVVRAFKALSEQGFTVVVDTSNNQEIPYINSALRIAEKIFLVATLSFKIQTRLCEMYDRAKKATGLELYKKMVFVINRVGYSEESGELIPQEMAYQFSFKNHYVVHEGSKVRNLAIVNKDFPVFIKSTLATELINSFDCELLGRAKQKIEKKPGFFSRLFGRKGN